MGYESIYNSFADPTQATLPKRGEKDFEPNPTLYQADVLSASRQAMHNALSYPRLHFQKHKIVGFYAPDGPMPPSSSRKQTSTDNNRNSHIAHVQIETGAPPGACVYVTNPKGQYFRTMGQADRWNRIWLLPEEALYLLERGTLDIRWPLSLTGGSDVAMTDNGQEQQEEPAELLPMSLQAAYSCLLGRAGLTSERFSVYTGLKRLGYSIIRAPSWDEDDDSTSLPAMTGNVDGDGKVVESRGLFGLLGRLFQLIYDSSSAASTAVGPVVGLGIHRNYSKFFFFFFVGLCLSKQAQLATFFETMLTFGLYRRHIQEA